jgi:hypothetical protein
MALTDHEVGLLYEVYEITMRDYTVVSGGSGQSRLMPDIYASGASVRDRLVQAIEQINLSPAQVERVQAILAEFEELSLDPSKIDKDGYQLRPSNNIKTIRTRLYPYTGISFNSSAGQRLSIG